jgi:hypothetical protein
MSEALNQAEARSWSKARIREEIKYRYSEIRESNRSSRDMERQVSRGKYRPESGDWWRGPAEYRDQMTREIHFLKSLL